MKPINKPLNENVSLITNQIIKDSSIDDNSNIKVYGNLLIKDKTTGTTLLNKRI